MYSLHETILAFNAGGTKEYIKLHCLFLLTDFCSTHESESVKHLFAKTTERKVYFILYLLKFKYVPLPAQHLGMCNI